MDTPRPKPGQPLVGKQNVPARPLTQGDRDALIDVLRKAGSGGCVEGTSHFRMRAAQRGFTTPDALNVLKRGSIVSGPEFCAEFCNWKFSVEFEHDNGELTIVAAVCASDVGRIWSDHVMLITGFVR